MRKIATPVAQNVSRVTNMAKINLNAAKAMSF